MTRMTKGMPIRLFSKLALLILLFAACWKPGSAQATAATDTTPPQIQSFSIDKTTVNVKYQSQTVTWTAHITDATSGCSSASLTIFSPSEVPYIVNGSLTSGTPTDGYWSFPLTMPQSSELGAWMVDKAVLEDTAGNTAVILYGPVFQVSNSNVVDTTPPQLQSLTVDRNTVDVSTQDQTVYFTAHITDDLSGCANATITIVNPVDTRAYTANGSLSSGTSTDGYWTFPLTIKKFSQAATWTVKNITLEDAAGNTVSPQNSTSIYVNDNNQDIIYPNVDIHTLSANKTTVDITNQDQIVTYTAHITDDISGVNNIAISTFIPYIGNYYLTSGIGSLFSGTSTDGYWNIPITFKRFSNIGTHAIGNITVADVAGNSAGYGVNNNIDTIQVTGTPDTTSPQIQSFSLSKSTIDVSTQNQTVTFTAHVIDDLSGVQSTTMSVISPTESHEYDIVGSLISGTPNDGYWAFTIKINKFSEAGPWLMDYILIEDAVGNTGEMWLGPGFQVTSLDSSSTVTVAFASGGNGAVNGTMTQSVSYGGASTAVTAVPAAGYSFVNWTGPYGFVSTANPLTITNATTSQLITANFSNGAKAVNGVCGSSNSGAFTAAPTANLCSAGTASSVTGNGPWNWTCAGTGGGTTASCQANIESYTVTFTAGTGGIINGTATQKINYGGSTASVTAVPATGYQFVNWTERSTVVGTSTTFIASGVTANHSYTANFAANSVSGACGSSNGGSFPAAPSTNLCSSGTASSVTGSGPWSWTCTGANGSSNASCSANKAGPDTTAPVVSFSVTPTTQTSTTITGISFSATDNVGVTGYQITESATKPSANGGNWQSQAPTSYTIQSSVIAGGATKTLCAWAKDAAGNVGGASATVTVNLPVQISWSVPMTPLSIPSAGKKSTIAFTAMGNGMQATASASTDSPDWISVTGDGTSVKLSKGKGSGKISYTVTANPSSAARTGTITVNGQAIQVTQAGVPCVVKSVMASPKSFAAAGGDLQISVTAPDACSWSVGIPAASESWLTSDSAAGTGTQQFTVSAAANNGSAVGSKYVKAKTRTATLTVLTTAGKKTLNLSQVGD